MIKLEVWEEGEWVEYTAEECIKIQAEYILDPGGKFGAIYCDGEYEGYIPNCSGAQIRTFNGILKHSITEGLQLRKE